MPRCVIAFRIRYNSVARGGRPKRARASHCASSHFVISKWIAVTCASGWWTSQPRRRLVSAEYPRGARGVAATRLRGISTRRLPRHSSPRNIHAAPAASPRPPAASPRPSRRRQRGPRRDRCPRAPRAKLPARRVASRGTATCTRGPARAGAPSPRRTRRRPSRLGVPDASRLGVPDARATPSAVSRGSVDRRTKPSTLSASAAGLARGACGEPLAASLVLNLRAVRRARRWYQSAHRS